MPGRPSKVVTASKKAWRAPQTRPDLLLRPDFRPIAESLIASGHTVGKGLFRLVPSPIHSANVWLGCALGLQAIMPPLPPSSATKPSTKANSVENPTMPPLYVCYILRSKAKNVFSNRSYVGSTPDPPKRFRQHNGAIKGGAWRTSLNGPWEMEAFVYGFPNKLSALQVRTSHLTCVDLLTLRTVRMGVGCALTSPLTLHLSSERTRSTLRRRTGSSPPLQSAIHLLPPSRNQQRKARAKAKLNSLSPLLPVPTNLLSLPQRRRKAKPNRSMSSASFPKRLARIAYYSDSPLCNDS